MSAAQRLIALDRTKTIVPLGDGTNHQFNHSDLDHWNQPSGISTEEGELLYGLIRVVRPTLVLETGTNIGVSSSYICLGLQDNGFGHLTTIEHMTSVAPFAKKKLEEMGFDNFNVFVGEVEIFPQPQPESVDFMWLDTELAQRYAELVRFFPSVKPGGIICIHDLWTLDFDQFGGVPDDMRKLIQTGELRALTFNTPHGISVFQRRRESDHLADIQKSK